MLIKKGILGIGNILLKDEGFGVHVVRYLQSHYKFDEDIELLDGGTGGMALSSFIMGVQGLLIVDVILHESQPGTVLKFNLQDFKEISTHLRMSPHQLGILDVLALLNFQGCCPRKVDFLCVVPEDISSSVELSKTLLPLVSKVAQLAYDWSKNA